MISVFATDATSSDPDLLLSTKFNNENKNIPTCRRTFSDVLAGDTSAIFLAASPQTPNFQQRLFRHVIFHPLAKIRDMQEFLTLNLISTLTQSCSAVIRAYLVIVNFHSEC